jgi:vacuolar protein sorting-associated protein IST1
MFFGKRRNAPPRLQIDTKRLSILLQLSIQRMHVIIDQTKAQQPHLRKQIADLLRGQSNGQATAQIRTESLIRQDYLISALNILQVYCEVLASRLDLMQQTEQCDEGLVEAVGSICWAAARVPVSELKRVAELLKVRFGDEFYQKTLQPEQGSLMVNSRLVQQLSVRPPEPALVQQYIEAISTAYSVVVAAGTKEEQEQPDGEKSKLDDLMKRLENLKRK